MPIRRPTYTPGSRGPFSGPNQKQLEELESAANAARSTPECGLVFGVGTHGLLVGALTEITPPANRLLLYLCRPIPHRMRLAQARAYVQIPHAGPAKAAIYTLDKRKTFVKIAGSEAVFPTTPAGMVSVPLGQDVFLEPWRTYAIGFTTPGGHFTGFTVSGTSNVQGIVPFFNFPNSTLLDKIVLDTSNKDYMDLDEGMVDVVFITNEGKELF